MEDRLALLQDTICTLYGQQQALLAGLQAVIAASNLKPARAPIELDRLVQIDADLQLLHATDERAQDLVRRGRENYTAAIHDALLRSGLPREALQALRDKGSSL